MTKRVAVKDIAAKAGVSIGTMDRVLHHRDHGNNHSTWWVAQVAMFSKLINDEKQLEFCRNFFKKNILPKQMDSEGRFIDEIKRTKPYVYSLFNLEGFDLVCELLSTPKNNLWKFETTNGQSMKKAFDFMYPHIKDKSQWPYAPEVEYFDELPLRGGCFVFWRVCL